MVRVWTGRNDKVLKSNSSLKIERRSRTWCCGRFEGVDSSSAENLRLSMICPGEVKKKEKKILSEASLFRPEESARLNFGVFIDSTRRRVFFPLTIPCSSTRNILDLSNWMV